jgi:triacylglycerol lipase
MIKKARTSSRMAISEVIHRGRKVASVAARELTANLIALNLYPLGALNLLRRTDAHPHPHYAQNPRPVLLVHGMAHNHSAFISLRKRMAASHWHNVFTINYATRHGSLTGMVDELSQLIEEILIKTQSTQIDVVAHSLGGIVSRYYMCLGEGRGKIKNLVTLGSPHQGTGASRLLTGLPFGALKSDLRNGSYLMKLLGQTALPRGSTITSIYSEFDWTVWPQANCEVEGSPSNSFKNVKVSDCGHIGLLYSPQVADIVMRTLTQ